MKEFMMRCDTPNWAFIGMLTLCYMYRVAVECLEHYRVKEFERLSGEEHP